MKTLRKSPKKPREMSRKTENDPTNFRKIKQNSQSQGIEVRKSSKQIKLKSKIKKLRINSNKD